MNKLQSIAGVSAILQALIYVVAFIYFGAFFTYPSDGSALEKMTYLAENQFVFSMMYFLMYAVFGILLAILVVGLYETLKLSNDAMVKVGSVFGIVWVVLVIASGMLANIGLAHSINLMESSPEKAFDMWQIVYVFIESLGGGNELVGGLWVLLMSLASLKAAVFSRGLNYLGLVVGISGIATIYPEEALTEIFGITQIIWFIWLGVSMLSHGNVNNLKQTSFETSAN